MRSVSLSLITAEAHYSLKRCQPKEILKLSLNISSVLSHCHSLHPQSAEVWAELNTVPQV